MFKYDKLRDIALYYIENNSTVRATAKFFGYSKSYIHKLLSENLKKYDYNLYKQVRKISDLNQKEKHIRGGLAIKNKFAMKNK